MTGRTRGLLTYSPGAERAGDHGPTAADSKLPTVVADWREPPERIAELEARGFEVLYEQAQAYPELDFGDYCWQSRTHGFTVGVEVKKVPEMLARFKTKELQRQLRGLYDSYDIPIFCFGGKLSVTKDGFCDTYGWDQHRVLYDGFMNWLHLSLPQDLPGLLVDSVPDDQLLMHRVASYVHYFEKQDHKATWSVDTRRPLFSMDDTELAALRALMFPKIGEEMAGTILNEMSTWEVLQDVFENGGKKLLKVYGMGKERVASIRKVASYKRG